VGELDAEQGEALRHTDVAQVQEQNAAYEF